MRSARLRLPGPPLAQWSVAALALAGVVLAALEPSAVSITLAAAVVGLCILYIVEQRNARPATADLERIVAEHRMLRESIEGNPMAYAVYDAQDRLIAYNKTYEALHAEAFRRLRHLVDARQLQYGDLVRVTAEATMSPEQVEEHVAERVRRQRNADGIAVDREYPGMGWKRVCKFATPSGAVAGFALDIGELKQREADLEVQVARSLALESQLRGMADTDVLTGLPNRRSLLERATAEFQRARRYAGGFGVAMMDVDEFKSINDQYGHAGGDAVLVGIAAACRVQLRADVDVCGRIGGEEFAFLLPQTAPEGALAFAERMRLAIAALEFEGGGRRFRVTVSLGVSCLVESDASFDTLLARADAALYAAKSGGRNCVRAG